MAYSHHDGDFGNYMRDKVDKLGTTQNKLDISDIISNIFSGCSIFVNGFTNPPLDVLRVLFVKHGGIFHAYQKVDTTHFVCNYFNDGQVPRILNTRSKMFYVNSDWIINSIARNKKLPEADYIPKDIRGVNGSSLNNFFSSKSNMEIKSSTTNDDKMQLNNNSVSSSSKDSVIKGIDSKINNSEENPNFIEQFFSLSRLHFIGAWRSRLPRLLSELGLSKRIEEVNVSNTVKTPFTIAAVSNSISKGSTNGRIILHIDMDCFFVSALTRDNPELDSIPIGVAHSAVVDGTSEISSCNYVARSFGIKAGMFMRKAKELCPQLKILANDFTLYENISMKFYKILFESSALIVEPVSVDEAYLEFSDNVNSLELAEQLRFKIFSETKCRASVGISYNMLLARLATRKAKPNGVFSLLSSQSVQDHLRDLKIDDIPNVGHSLKGKLYQLNVRNCSQLQEIPIDVLKTQFGDLTGLYLFNACRGIDNTQLSNVKPPQSINCSVNWGIRFTKLEKVLEFLAKLSKHTADRLIKAGYKAQQFVLKIKRRHVSAPLDPPKFLGHGSCDDFSKSVTINNSTDNSDDIYSRILPLYQSLAHDNNIIVTDLRGLGIQASKLISCFNSTNRLSPSKPRNYYKVNNSSVDSKLCEIKSRDNYSIQSLETSGMNTDKRVFEDLLTSNDNLDTGGSMEISVNNSNNAVKSDKANIIAAKSKAKKPLKQPINKCNHDSIIQPPMSVIDNINILNDNCDNVEVINQRINSVNTNDLQGTSPLRDESAFTKNASYSNDASLYSLNDDSCRVKDLHPSTNNNDEYFFNSDDIELTSSQEEALSALSQTAREEAIQSIIFENQQKLYQFNLNNTITNPHKETKARKGQNRMKKKSMFTREVAAKFHGFNPRSTGDAEFDMHVSPVVTIGCGLNQKVSTNVEILSSSSSMVSNNKIHHNLPETGFDTVKILKPGHSYVSNKFLSDSQLNVTSEGSSTVDETVKRSRILESHCSVQGDKHTFVGILDNILESWNDNSYFTMMRSIRLWLQLSTGVMKVFITNNDTFEIAYSNEQLVKEPTSYHYQHINQFMKQLVTASEFERLQVAYKTILHELNCLKTMDIKINNDPLEKWFNCLNDILLKLNIISREIHGFDIT